MFVCYFNLNVAPDTLFPHATHLSLLLVQLPRQLLNHLLLFHQHLVLFSFQAVHGSAFPRPLSPAALVAPCQAVLHAELGRGRLQGELRRRGHWHVAEAVGERAAEGQLGGGRRDGRGGGGAGVWVVASLGQGAGGGRGLVGRQGPGGCDGEGHRGDVGGAWGRGAGVAVLEGPESLDEGGLGAWDRHASDTQVLPELWDLTETETQGWDYIACTEQIEKWIKFPLAPTFRSSRLAGRGPGLTGEMLLWLGYVLFTGEEELLLAVLDGPLGLQADICSPDPLQWHKGSGLIIYSNRFNVILITHCITYKTSLCSQKTGSLVVPSVCKSRRGGRAFSYQAPPS